MWPEFKSAPIFRLTVHSLPTGPALCALRGSGDSRGSAHCAHGFGVFLEATFVFLHLRQCCEDAVRLC